MAIELLLDVVNDGEYDISYDSFLGASIHLLEIAKPSFLCLLGVRRVVLFSSRFILMGFFDSCEAETPGVNNWMRCRSTGGIQGSSATQVLED